MAASLPSKSLTEPWTDELNRCEYTLKGGSEINLEMSYFLLTILLEIELC